MARLNLPSPARTVRRSVGVCLRMGYTETQALGLIQAVCKSVVAGTPSGGEFDLTWLAEVYEVARCRQQKLAPPPA